MNKIYNIWIKNSCIEEELKKEIYSLSQEEINIYFSEEKPSFGTAGIRQKMGLGTRRFNRYTYQQLAIGYAKHLCRYNKHPKIIIGHDNRKFSAEFSVICAEVFSSFGIEVFLFKNNELKATPIVSFLISHLKLDGGIIITASHNPKDYNGFKVYKSNGGQILDQDAKDIITFMPDNETILDIKYYPKYELIKEIDDCYIDEYFEKAKNCLIKTDINKDKNFPIIFTPHHGTAYKDLPYFLSTIGYSNIILVKEQSFPDENFVNSPISNPEEEESFILAIEYAKKNNAKIILGVDPDADRLAVVIKTNDGNMKYISGNEMGIIFSYYCLKNKEYNRRPFIVSTHVSTNLIDRIAQDFSCIVFRTGTGFKWLATVVEDNYKDNDFIVAFEEAIGSLNSTINRDKDSFQASALALEIFDYYQKIGMDLNQLLFEEIYPKYGFWSGQTISFVIKDLNWIQKSNRIMDYMKNLKFNEINGIKLLKKEWNFNGDCLEWIFENDNTIKFRQSGTEPKFKVYLNIYGYSKENSDKNFFMFKEYIKNILDIL